MKIAISILISILRRMERHEGGAAGDDCPQRWCIVMMSSVTGDMVADPGETATP